MRLSRILCRIGSWKHDRFRVRVLVEAFRGRTLGDLSPLAIESFKNSRQLSLTKRNPERSPASVNRELELLSRIFSLAIRLGLAESSPCSRVSKFKLLNQRYRYLLPDEEPALLRANVPMTMYGVIRQPESHILTSSVLFPRLVPMRKSKVSFGTITGRPTEHGWARRDSTPTI